jgi:hypothetical protein
MTRSEKFLAVILVLLTLLLWSFAVLKGEESATQSWRAVRWWPVEDLKRVENWETALQRCPVCVEEAETEGEFRLIRRMKREGYYLFYAFALEIPSDSGLVFDRYSSIIMTVEAEGDSTRPVYLESDQIVFCIGWSPFYQVEERVNTESPVYVKPIPLHNEPSSEDYEWVRIRGEQFPTYYVLGYARFPGLETTKIRAVLNRQFTGVTTYPVGR